MESQVSVGTQTTTPGESLLMSNIPSDKSADAINVRVGRAEKE